MKTAEARAAIGDAVSAAIAEELTRDQQQWLGDVPPPPAVVAGRYAAGHDASKVPAEPRALWLRSPMPTLGYDKPLELIRDGEFRRVIQALEALGYPTDVTWRPAQPAGSPRSEDG